MTTFRRLALGFPIAWSHHRAYSFVRTAKSGTSPYFVEWDPGHGVYGEDWRSAAVDASGVLLSGQTQAYHPIRIAQFALHRFGVWHSSGDREALGDFLAQALWLRDHQHNGAVPGLYRFEFPWRKYGAENGWCSAMAQGEAISVLLRAHAVDPSAGYGDAAERASRPFLSTIGEGGVTWRSGTDLFLEEIANEHAPHVLNGCIFALWGVWELWRAGGDRGLGRIVEDCVGTLQRWLPRFDTGWWTRYSLLISGWNLPHVATLKYHQFHIAQMHVLAQMFDEPAFENAAQRWTAYIDNNLCRARVIGAALQSLPERLSGCDTVAGGARA